MPLPSLAPELMVPLQLSSRNARPPGPAMACERFHVEAGEAVLQMSPPTERCHMTAPLHKGSSLGAAAAGDVATDAGGACGRLPQALDRALAHRAGGLTRIPALALPSRAHLVPPQRQQLFFPVPV